MAEIASSNAASRSTTRTMPYGAPDLHHERPAGVSRDEHDDAHGEHPDQRGHGEHALRPGAPTESERGSGADQREQHDEGHQRHGGVHRATSVSVLGGVSGSPPPSPNSLASVATSSLYSVCSPAVKAVPARIARSSASSERVSARESSHER